MDLFYSLKEHTLKNNDIISLEAKNPILFIAYLKCSDSEDTGER